MKSRVLLLFLAAVALLAGYRTGYCLELVVTANVPGNTPSLTTTILKFTDGDPDNNPWTNSTQETTLDFGELTFLLDNGTNAGSFYSKAGYCVVIFAEPFGKPFSVSANCAGVADTNGHSLPVGSFGMIPVYSSSDQWKYAGGQNAQGDMPAGARLGNSESVVPGGLVYTSESGSATARILQLYLALSPLSLSGRPPYNGYVPIPLTQPPGHYTATVTLTFSPQ